MNDKLEKVLDLIIKGIENGSELVNSQGSEVFKEIINLGFYSSLTYVVIFGFLMIISLATVGYSGYRCMESDMHSECERMFEFLASCVGLLIISCIFCHQASDLIKVSVAPKVYAIEQVREMMK